jgi:hypothetical protein
MAILVKIQFLQISTIDISIKGVSSGKHNIVAPILCYLS